VRRRPKYPVGFGYLPPAPNLNVDFEADATVALEEAVNEVGKEHPDVAIDARVVHGFPARVLPEMARDADLLVVGSHGRGALTEMLLGSVSHGCVHHAPCPVVVVRGERARADRRAGCLQLGRWRPGRPGSVPGRGWPCGPEVTRRWRSGRRSRAGQRPMLPGRQTPRPTLPNMGLLSLLLLLCAWACGPVGHLGALRRSSRGGPLPAPTAPPWQPHGSTDHSAVDLLQPGRSALCGRRWPRFNGW
jgi:hypothetical protein